MDQISPHPLWLGRGGEGRDYRRVINAGIQALVHLAEEETPDQPPRKLIYYRIPLVEGAGNPSVLLDLAVSTVADLLRLRVPTLLYGDGGVSRIPTIAAVALSLIFGETPEKCFSWVVQQHACDVTPGLWDEVKEMLDRRVSQQPRP
jgi:hypothetical protein